MENLSPQLSYKCLLVSNKIVSIKTAAFLAEDNYVLGRTVLYTVTYNAFIYAKQIYVILHKNKTCVTSLFSFIEGYKGLK